MIDAVSKPNEVVPEILPNSNIIPKLFSIRSLESKDLPTEMRLIISRGGWRSIDPHHSDRGQSLSLRSNGHSTSAALTDGWQSLWYSLTTCCVFAVGVYQAENSLHDHYPCIGTPKAWKVEQEELGPGAIFCFIII